MMLQKIGIAQLNVFCTALTVKLSLSSSLYFFNEVSEALSMVALASSLTANPYGCICFVSIDNCDC